MANASAPIIILGMPPEVWSIFAIGLVGFACKWLFGLPNRGFSDDELFDAKHLEPLEDEYSAKRLNDKVNEAILRHHRTQNR